LSRSDLQSSAHDEFEQILLPANQLAIHHMKLCGDRGLYPLNNLIKGSDQRQKYVVTISNGSAALMHCLCRGKSHWIALSAVSISNSLALRDQL
jgi:hypothetical protein